MKSNIVYILLEFVEFEFLDSKVDISS